MQFQKISIPTQRGSLERGRGGGVSKAKIFKRKYKTKLEFPEGWGGELKPKEPSVGRVWIFSGTTHLTLSLPEVIGM